MNVRHFVKRLNSIRPLAACLALTLAGGAWLFAAGPDKPHAKVDKAVAGLTADAGEATGHRNGCERPEARPGTNTCPQAASRARRPRVDRRAQRGVVGAGIEDLIADPAVSHVSIDANVHSFLDEVGTLDTNMLLPTLALPHQGFTGKGVGVAVLDTGIVEPARSRSQRSTTSSTEVRPPSLSIRSATAHVAGLIMDKQGKSDARYRSVAKGVRLIGLRVLDASGSGYTSTVIQAIEFAIANKAKLGIDVLNLSLGHPIYEPAATDPLVQAVERAVAAGIVVVTSAGNEGTNRVTGQVGYAGITSPGNAPSAITVGAVDTRNTITRLDDQVTTFSSRGPTCTTRTRSLTWWRRAGASSRSWRRRVRCTTGIRTTGSTWRRAPT